MKNISPPILPNIHGFRSENTKTFLFEFDMLCRSYDNLHDAQNLKLFLVTLKDVTLKWFIGLGIISIRKWEQVKATLLEKYKDYCMPHNIKGYVLKMIQKEDENIEHFIKRFSYTVKTGKVNHPNEETLKALLLKYIRDEWIDILNIMDKGEISQLSQGEICELCIHISRGKARTKKNPRDLILSRIIKSAAGTISRVELGNFLDNLKKYILGSLSAQIGTLKIQNKEKYGNNTLSIFFP